MKPKAISLVTPPLEPSRATASLYTVDPRGLGQLSQALRKDTMAEYAKAYPG